MWRSGFGLGSEGWHFSLTHKFLLPQDLIYRSGDPTAFNASEGLVSDSLLTLELLGPSNPRAHFPLFSIKGLLPGRKSEAKYEQV